MVAGGALLSAGESVGEYTVVALLEPRDGLEIYAAMTSDGGRQVVLECRAAGPQGVDDAGLFELVERLIRFRDPRVPATFAGGTHAGVVWIAREPIEGTPLGEVVRARGAIALGVALSHVQELLEVLMAAERCGLRHGSLSSSSVVLCPDLPELRVLGIGVAQAFGRNVRAAADVRGAAAVLYEMLTGFAPENPCVPISRVLWGVPRSLCAVLDRALESDARARHESLRYFARALKAVEREPVVQREIQQALERAVTVFGVERVEPEEDARDEGLDQKRHQPKARARSRALERAKRGRREMPPGGALIAPDDRRPLLTVVGERVGQELTDVVEEAAFGEFLFTLIYLGVFPLPPDSEPAAAPSTRGDEAGAGERAAQPPPKTEEQPARAPSVPSLAPPTPVGPSTLRSRVPQPPLREERSDPVERAKRLLHPALKRRLGRGLASVVLVVSAFLFLRAASPLRVEPKQALCVDLGGTASFPLQDLAPFPVAPPPPPAAPTSTTPRPMPAPAPARRKPKAPQKAELDPVRERAYRLSDDGTATPRSQ